jgi:hypothetical protein
MFSNVVYVHCIGTMDGLSAPWINAKRESRQKYRAVVIATRIIALSVQISRISLMIGICFVLEVGGDGKLANPESSDWKRKPDRKEVSVAEKFRKKQKPGCKSLVNRCASCI